jgi:hypothetical protein
LMRAPKSAGARTSKNVSPGEPWSRQISLLGTDLQRK